MAQSAAVAPISLSECTRILGCAKVSGRGCVLGGFCLLVAATHALSGRFDPDLVERCWQAMRQWCLEYLAAATQEDGQPFARGLTAQAFHGRPARLPRRAKPAVKVRRRDPEQWFADCFDFLQETRFGVNGFCFSDSGPSHTRALAAVLQVPVVVIHDDCSTTLSPSDGSGPVDFALTPANLRYVLLQGHSTSEDYIVLHCAKGHYTGYRRLPQDPSPPAKRPRLHECDEDYFLHHTPKDLHQGHVHFDGWDGTNDGQAAVQAAAPPRRASGLKKPSKELLALLAPLHRRLS